MNKNMLHLCEQEHRCTSKTFMCVYFYTFHQGKFSNVLRFTSRSLKLCHQGISFIHMSAFGLNNIILSRPSKHQIYLLTDPQYQLNLPISMFLFSFRNAWWMDIHHGMNGHFPSPKIPFDAEQTFWSFHQEATF